MKKDFLFGEDTFNVAAFNVLWGMIEHPLLFCLKLEQKVRKNRNIVGFNSEKLDI